MAAGRTRPTPGDGFARRQAKLTEEGRLARPLGPRLLIAYIARPYSVRKSCDLVDSLC
jgi:hypothetical protein